MHAMKCACKIKDVKLCVNVFTGVFEPSTKIVWNPFWCHLFLDF